MKSLSTRTSLREVSLDVIFLYLGHIFAKMFVLHALAVKILETLHVPLNQSFGQLSAY